MPDTIVLFVGSEDGLSFVRMEYGQLCDLQGWGGISNTAGHRGWGCVVVVLCHQVLQIFDSSLPMPLPFLFQFLL